MTVLVVEDDPYFRYALGTLLSREGFEVATAANGSEGLTHLRSRRADVVLLDLSMPVMNGEEFLDAKVGDTQIADVPTIVMSGEREGPSLNRSGAYAVLRKPFEIDRLLRLLRGTR